VHQGLILFLIGIEPAQSSLLPGAEFVEQNPQFFVFSARQIELNQQFLGCF
jgi:hypothetical protein